MAIAVVVAMLVLPATSFAGCGGVFAVRASHHPRGRPAPLAIGDSTMLLALDDLGRAGYNANAHGCRQYGEALAILRARKAARTLPHMIVIALGADGSVTSGDIAQTLDILGRKRLLVLVTPRELGGGSGSDAATERAWARAHTKRIRLLDWVKFSAGHPDWFQPDGLHLTTTGAQAFTGFLKKALPWAYPPRRHHRR